MPTTNTFAFVNPNPTTLVTTAETAALTMLGLYTRGPSDQILFDGQAKVTTGTGVTAVVVTLRRGNGITGAIVGQAESIPEVASTVTEVAWTFVDSPPESANAPYTLTVTQTGATGNGTVNYVAGGATLP